MHLYQGLWGDLVISILEHEPPEYGVTVIKKYLKQNH